MAFVIEYGAGIGATFYSDRIGRDRGAPGGGWARSKAEATHFETREAAQKFLDTRLPYQAPDSTIVPYEPGAEALKLPTKPDYYAVLGVARDATAEEIKRAYRHLAMQHHPDRNAGGAARFVEIGQAYEVLSDPDRRKVYDA